MGKSAAAAVAALQLRRRFADGQIYAELGGLEHPRDPQDVLADILQSVGIGARAIPLAGPARAAMYRSVLANRKILVIADDAAYAAQVRPLVPAAGGAAILVTSRSPLAGLVGARQVRLGELAPEDALALLDVAAGPDRVGAEPAAAREIVAACAGMPLAILIAGAVLAARPGLGLARFARDCQSDHILDALACEDSSVRAAIGSSYRALPVAAQAAFSLAATVMQDEIPAWALAELAAGDVSVAGNDGRGRAVGASPGRGVRSAVPDASACPGLRAGAALPRRSSGGRSPGDRSPGEQSPAVLTRGALARRALTCRALTRRALRRPPGRSRTRSGGCEPHGSTSPIRPRPGCRRYRSSQARHRLLLPRIPPRPAPTPTRAWLDCERTNLLTAVVQAAAAGDYRAAGALASRLIAHQCITGAFADASTGWSAVAAAATRAGDARHQAIAEYYLAVGLAESHERVSEVAVLLAGALPELERAGEREIGAMAHALRARCASAAGRHAAAIRAARRAIELAGPDGSLARCCATAVLGLTLARVGITHAGIEQCEQARADARQLQEPAYEAYATRALAQALMVSGQYPAAVSACGDGIELARQYGSDIAAARFLLPAWPGTAV